MCKEKLAEEQFEKKTYTLLFMLLFSDGIEFINLYLNASAISTFFLDYLLLNCYLKKVSIKNQMREAMR